jgi:hypothetical protein
MRRLLLRTIPVLISVASPLLAQPGASKSAVATLPTVTSYALDKSKVTLPEDLAGMQNVLVLYFEPDQSDAALAWVNSLASVSAAHSEVKSYLVPVYGKENFLYRWWVDASTRSAAPPSQDRHTTIPIFVDKASFLRPLGVLSEKQPFVLLTDKAGHVRWKIQGAFEQWRFNQLLSEIGGVSQWTSSKGGAVH